MGLLSTEQEPSLRELSLLATRCIAYGMSIPPFLIQQIDLAEQQEKIQQERDELEEMFIAPWRG